MLLRANRKRSLKVRECRITEKRGRNKVSMKKGDMRTVSGSWSLHSKGRGDCRLTQQGRGELIKLY